MSGFLLDTNIPSEMLRPRPDVNVAAFSVVTMGELCRGVTLLAEHSSRRVELERIIHEEVPSWFQDRVTRNVKDFANLGVTLLNPSDEEKPS